MTPLINALLGPAALLAALSYARATWVSAANGDSHASIAGLGICTFVLSWLATFRMARTLGMDPTVAADYVFAMGVPVYAVHCYVALRLAQSAVLRGKLRREAARQLAIVADLTGDRE